MPQIQSFRERPFVRLDSLSDRPDHYNKGKGSGKTKTYGDRSGAPLHVPSHATDVTSDQKVGSRNTAITCKLCYKVHDLDDSQANLKRSLAERKELLREKGFAWYAMIPDTDLMGVPREELVTSVQDVIPRDFMMTTFASIK